MPHREDETKIGIEMEIRLRFRNEPGRLDRALGILREEGGGLRSHLLYRFDEDWVGLFLCEDPTSAALSLKNAGYAMETETVVVVRTPHRPGILSQLIRTLQAENVALGYNYAVRSGGDVFVVLRTEDNPAAEDALRNFLVMEDAPRVGSQPGS